MAKSIVAAPPVVVAAAPRRRRRTQAVQQVVRRGTTAAAKAAADNKHLMYAGLGAFALGYAKRQGIKLPQLGSLTTEQSVALLAFGAAAFTRNKTLRHVATGAVAVAAYQFGAEGSSPLTVRVQGEDDQSDILGIDL